jgi:hypothetical protein
LVGEEGKTVLRKIEKESGSSGIINKLKDWINKFWKNLRSTFGLWSDEQLEKLTLDDFNHMTLRDFATGESLDVNEYLNDLQQ